MNETGHTPVLVDEVLAALSPAAGDVIVDCTLGRGGHALALATAGGDAGSVHVVGVDRDRDNLDFAATRLVEAGVPFTPIHDSFVRVPHHLRRLELEATVLLADLGFSSNQMDDPRRGFAFRHDAPLDMRFDRTTPVTAADLVASLPEKELADLIYRFGEDPMARTIARKLVREREVRPIQTTARLAGLVEDAYGHRARSSRMHPATRTFMALRIAVNDELAALDALLDQIVRAAERLGPGRWLAPEARLAVISFHSLEDRSIKHCFADLVQRQLATPILRGAARPAEAESAANPRSRSARLRAVRLSG